MRRDALVDCYPLVPYWVIDAIAAQAARCGRTRTQTAARLAHLSLWSYRVLDQLQPYLILPVELEWDSGLTATTTWLPTTLTRIPRIEDGARLKFRLSIPDVRRLHLLHYATLSKGRDSLWPLLLSWALREERVLSML